MSSLSVRELLGRSPTLRRLRARLPYRKENWKTRAMSYWGWNEERDGLLYQNICGPSATRESIETTSESIVWLAKPGADDVCLDLGCGVARVEKFLAPKVRAIHAVDFSTAMLLRAHERMKDSPNVFFYQNDGETLDLFAYDFFDLAWAELVFHHVPIEVTRKYIAGTARVLKPNGRFVCQLPRKEFYELQSRDICGWMTIEQAQEMMQSYFRDTRLWEDERHIYALVADPVTGAGERNNGGEKRD